MHPCSVLVDFVDVILQDYYHSYLFTKIKNANICLFITGLPLRSFFTKLHKILTKTVFLSLLIFDEKRVK